MDDLVFDSLGMTAKFCLTNTGALPATRVALLYYRHINPRSLLPSPNAAIASVQPPFGNVISSKRPFCDTQRYTDPENARREMERIMQGSEVLEIALFVTYFDGFEKRITWRLYVFDRATHHFSLLSAFES